MKIFKKILLFAVVLIFILALLWYFAPAAPRPKTPHQPSSSPEPKAEEITIGILAPLSGPLALFGESIEKGAQTALKVINDAGGIKSKSRRLGLRVYDTRSSADLAGEFLKKLREKDGAKVVIGTATKEAALMAAKMANETKTPFIYLANGALMTCSPTNPSEPSPYVWGAGLTDLMRTEPFLVFLADSFGSPESKFNIYYLTIDVDSARTAAKTVQEAAESMDFRFVDEQLVDERISDYYQYLRVIFHKKANVLYLSLSEKTLKPVIEQAAKIGIKADYKPASLFNFEEERLRALGDAAEGMYSAERYASDIDTPEQKVFLAAWNHLYSEIDPSPPTALSAAVYSSLLAVRDAFEIAPDFSAEAFGEAMKQVEIKAPQGDIFVDRRNNLFVQPLYATVFEGGKFKTAGNLGEASHPLLEGCTFAQTKDPKQ